MANQQLRLNRALPTTALNEFTKSRPRSVVTAQGVAISDNQQHRRKFPPTARFLTWRG